MSKIIEFKKPSSYYIELSQRKADEGKLITAINLLRYALSSVQNKFDLEDVLLASAQIYADMGRFENSNEAYFSLLSKGLSKSDCYFGLAQNYYCLNNNDLSNHYFSLLQEEEPDLNSEELGDLLEMPEYDFDRGLYKVVYPVPNVDAEKAKTLIGIGLIDEAIDLLKDVKKKDPNYVDAMSDLTMCYMVKEDFFKALDIAEKALVVDSESILTLTNLTVLYKITKNPEKMNEAVEILKKCEAKTPFERTKLATTFCELADHKESLKYLTMVLEDRPYNQAFMTLQGIAYYNLLDFENALTVFDNMLKIDPMDTIAKYYIRFVKNAIEKRNQGEKQFPSLLYMPQIPYSEILDRFKYMDTLLSSGNIKSFDDENSLDSEFLTWLLATNDNALQQKAVSVISKSNLKDSQIILKDILMSDSVSKQIKFKAFEGLLQKGIRTVQLTNNGKFFSSKVYYPNGFVDYKKQMKNAYCMGYSAVTFLNVDKQRIFVQEIQRLNQIAVDRDFKNLNSPSVAVLAISNATLNKLIPEEILCDIIGVTFKTYKKYKEMFK